MFAQIERRIERAKQAYLRQGELRTLLDWALTNPGRTVAIRPPEELRLQIDRIQKRHGFSSVKAAVLAALLVGVRVLDEDSANEAA